MGQIRVFAILGFCYAKTRNRLDGLEKGRRFWRLTGAKMGGREGHYYLCEIKNFAKSGYRICRFE